MKSEILNTKVLFKLNHHLLKKNLPNITPTKFNQKQNHSFTHTLDDGFKFLPKNNIKSFNLPKRFKKHNNKIQDNMTVLNKTSSDFVSTAATKTCSSSFHKPVQQSPKQESKKSFLSKHRSKLSINQLPSRPSLQPRTLQGIEKAFEQKSNQKLSKDKDKKSKTSKPYETMMRLRPRKISKEISQIFYQNKHLYMLSRFTLLELKSYYCAILKFAKNEPSKFKYAFEIMLNLANVTVRENIMTECLKELMQGGLTFTKFLKAFTGIQQKLRKQAIIDYFEILLEDVKKANITYDELTRTFQGRMRKQVASELTVLLYEKLGKDDNQTINKKQIHLLCYENEQFCTMFYALNNQNMLNNKFEPPSKGQF